MGKTILDGVWFMNRLIFIEGVSGVGKTTTASLLHNKLWDMGITFDCYLEGDCRKSARPVRRYIPA